MFARKSAFVALVVFAVWTPIGTAPWVEGSAFAAPGGRYTVGMRVRAKRDCSVQGFQVKKGVVLNVAAVKTDDKGKVGSVDLTISGMTINNIPTNVMDSLFAPA